MKQETFSALRPYSDIILQHIPVRVGLYDVYDLRLLDANELYLEGLKKYLPPDWCEENLIGHSLAEWELTSIGHSLLMVFRSAQETGEALQGEATPFTSPSGEVTYWNWKVSPISEPDGRLKYLLHTGVDVSEQIRARQNAEERRASLDKTNQELQAEKRRLEVVEIIARSIDEEQGKSDESLDKDPPDIEKISKIAVNAILEHLSPSMASIHVTDPEQQVFRLLSLRAANWNGPRMPTQSMPYERLFGKTCLHSPSEPLVIEDVPAAIASGDIPSNSILVRLRPRSLVSIPLWSGDYLEGLLNVLFDRPICSESLETRILSDCGKHIAFALATARKHVAVKREQAWLYKLLRQLPESIMIIEVTNGRINYANPATSQLLGTPELKLEGLILHEHPAAQLAGEMIKNGLNIEPWNFAIVRALGGVVLRNVEAQVMQRDGTPIIVHMSSAPLWMAQGVAKEVAIVMQDVTAQKILERQKKEFLSMVNHELRTPLTVIQGFAEILSHIIPQPHTDSLLQTAIANIVEQSEHLVRLIEEMLDITRIEHEQFTLQRGQHNLLHTLADVIRSQRVTTKRHQISFALDGIQPGEHLMGNYDEKRIKQVLHNLISNAIKYSPAGGEIEVGLRYLPHLTQEVLIWVKDQGIGIAEDNLPHIFKRFHRVNNLDRSLSGLGIGLYLVKEVVTRHGGYTWVESREDEGSTFFVTLPLYATTIPIN